MGTLTTCTLDCPDRCSIRCDNEKGRLRLRGNPDHPYTRGFTCEKIHRYPGRLLSPDRIRQPHVRRNGEFRPATWEEALDHVCTAIEKTQRDEDGSMLLVRGAGSMGASKGFANYVFGMLGARNVRGNLCNIAGLAAVKADAGAVDMNDPEQIERADGIVLWGKHPRACSIHTAVQVENARKRGVPVVAVNPDAGMVKGVADRVVRVRPGTDRFLALACARLLLDRKARPAPWERAANRQAFEAVLAEHSVAGLLDSCGLSREEADALVDLYAASPRTATVVGWGLQRYAHGAENVRAIHALAFVAGTLGVEGGGLYYGIPPFRHLRWPRTGRPKPPSLCLPTLGDELRRADPPVRFAWVSCTNVINQAPDLPSNREAFRAVEHRVVVDGFWTETALHASVVLPAALWLEEEDVVPSYWHNLLGAVRRVVEPPEGCRTDFEILRDLALRLGVEVPWEDVDQWLESCLPVGDGAPTLAELRARGWAHLDWPSIAWADGFGHEDGRFRLLEALSPEPEPDGGYPLRLLTPVRRDALHSQMLPEEQVGLLPVRLHPETAESFGVQAGDQVCMVGVPGELQVRVELDPELLPGVAACPRGGWSNLGRGVNRVIPARLTDLGEGAAFYEAWVRLEPREAPPA